MHRHCVSIIQYFPVRREVARGRSRKLEQLKTELAEWITAQGDALLPHSEPYLTSEPVPDLN